MAKTDVKTVDEYISAQPRAVQSVLKRVRSIIRKAVPAAEEVISYKIPTYKLNGRVMLYFAGWKEHYSLYPSGDNLVAAFKDDLAPYEISKGTIRFPLSEPVPVRLIELAMIPLVYKPVELGPSPLLSYKSNFIATLLAIPE
jgi:uncharacterized protein YdhG (YjbR/CyaY superfamily)